MKIANPSPELIEAAEAAGLYVFGHPDPTPNPRHIAAQRMADILKIPFLAALACMDRGAEIERERQDGL